MSARLSTTKQPTSARKPHAKQQQTSSSTTHVARNHPSTPLDRLQHTATKHSNKKHKHHQHVRLPRLQHAPRQHAETKQGQKPTNEVLAGKDVVGLYFSAHWCPPCRGFTPQLGKFYDQIKDAKNFEIIFVSSDRDASQFKE